MGSAVKRYIDDCLPAKKAHWAKTTICAGGLHGADVHRILTRGVFFMTRDQRASGKNGKLRLMYEANPMSFIVEQAGGAAIDAASASLTSSPKRCISVGGVLGSKEEVERVKRYHDEA